MTLESLRDLIIVIVGILVILATLGLMTLTLVLFFRVNSILKSVKSTTATINEIASGISDMVHVASFVQGVRRTVESISKLRGRKEKKG